MCALHPPKSFAELGIEGAFDIPALSYNAVVALIDTGAHRAHKISRGNKSGWLVLNGSREDYGHGRNTDLPGGND